MSILSELTKYCEDVLSGEIIACVKNKWACQRFLRDLERQGTKDFPYIFSEEKASKFISWMRFFKHRKGKLAGEVIQPHITQKFEFGNIYGWINKDTGYRRFNKAYIQKARKNAKSQSLGTVGSYEASAFGELSAEVYCTATKKDQAKIVWDEIDQMIKSCRLLDGKFKTAYGAITHLKSASVIKPLSKEDKKKGDGLSPSCGIVDEYHAHETSEYYDILESGMAARKQPLMIMITTAGFELNNPCYAVEYKYVSNILNPDSEIENDTYFAAIYELDTNDEGELIDDINDEKVWVKSNPIVASYPEGIKYLRDRLKAAQDVPEKMRDFLTKNMNVWINQRAAGYMNLAKWRARALKKDEKINVKGLKCTLGFDLSAVIDLTSVAILIELLDGRIYVKSHSFIPQSTLFVKMKTDKVPYDIWVKKGYITVTEGSAVDYKHMMRWALQEVERLELIEDGLCFDKYMANMLMQALAEEGHKVVDIPQWKSTLGIPTKDFRAKVYDEKIIHDDNPVLNWAIGNAVTTKIDANETFVLDKSKSSQRIDPIAAVINAYVKIWRNEQTKKSPYEDRGIRTY